MSEEYRPEKRLGPFAQGALSNSAYKGAAGERLPTREGKHGCCNKTAG